MYRKLPTGLANAVQVGSTSKLKGSYTLTGTSALQPGEWFLEARVGGVASKRLPIVIGGALLNLTAPSAVAIENGAVQVLFGTNPADGRVAFTLARDGGPAVSVTSPATVAVDSVGVTTLRVTADTPDGCSTSRTTSMEVFTCNPVLKVGTVVSPASPDASSVLVCEGGQHTTANGIASVYARTGTIVTLGNGINTVWLSSGATVVPGAGPLTLLYAGAKPTLSGGSITYVACPSIAFDTSALDMKCPPAP